MPPPTEPLKALPKRRGKKYRKGKKAKPENAIASGYILDFFHYLSADSDGVEAPPVSHHPAPAVGCKVKLVDTILLASGYVHFFPVR